MARHPANADRRTVERGEGAAKVVEDAVAVVGGDERGAVFGAEDEVDVHLGQGLRHRLESPFQGWQILLALVFPGRLPGLRLDHPFGAELIRPGGACSCVY